MADAAQFAIDIAAQMTGLETFAQLDALSVQLSGAGKGAEHFQQAIQRVAADLEVARAANMAASAALADGNAEYAQLERAALKAAKAAERAGLANEGVVPLEAAAAAAEAAMALEHYGVTLAGLEGEAKSAAAGEEALARQLKNVTSLSGHVDKRLAMNSEGLAKLQAGLSASGTSAGRLASQIVAPVKGFADLSQVVGTANAALLLGVSIAAAAAVALVAVAVAVGAATVGVAGWAIGLADGRRELDLTREAAEAMDPTLVGLRDSFAEISGGTGVAEASLRGLAKDLRDAKVSAADMPAALRAAALAEAALGQGGAASFVADIKAGKLAVDDFASTAERKFGGIVARQMLGLEAQGTRMKANISGLFGGLEIEGALGGLDTMVGLLDQNTAAGRAIKGAFEGIFQPLIDQAQLAAWVVEAFVLGVLIGATKLYIALKPTIAAVAELFGFEKPELEDVLAGITRAAEFVAPALLVIGVVLGGVVAAAMLLAAVPMAALGLAVAAVVAVIYGLAAAFNAGLQAVYGFGEGVVAAIGAAVSAVLAALGGVDLTGIGGSMMAGLAAGIGAGAAGVVSALTGAVQGALTAAKSMLGIASPSRVLATMGGQTIEGYTGGVEGEAPRAQAALAAAVAPPEVPPVSALELVDQAAAPATGGAAPAGRAAPAPAAPAAGAVDLHGATFNFYGVEGAQDAVARFGEIVTRIFEGDAAALGGEAAPA